MHGLLKYLVIASLIGAISAGAMLAQSRPTYPARDPHTPGYVKATELPDGANAPADRNGNFILGPTHTPAPEVSLQEGRREDVPQGMVAEFTMSSADSKLYPGIT